MPMGEASAHAVRVRLSEVAALLHCAELVTECTHTMAFRRVLGESHMESERGARSLHIDGTGRDSMWRFRLVEAEHELSFEAEQQFASSAKLTWVVVRIWQRSYNGAGDPTAPEALCVDDPRRRAIAAAMSDFGYFLGEQAGTVDVRIAAREIVHVATSIR